MFRYVQSVILLILIFVFPITSLYPHVTVANNQSLQTLSEFTEDISYDQLLNLLDEIEQGNLDRYSALEQAKIAHFVSLLAEKGMLSTEDNSALMEDIDLLLEGEENYYADASFKNIGGRIALVHGAHREIKPLYNANWFSKRCRYIKNFVKRHKRVLIIGAAVMVAGAVVITTLVVSSAKAAAAAAEAKVEEVKEIAAEEGLFDQTEEGSLPVSENARVLGSVIAHEVLEQLPQKNDPEWPHFEIDQSFGLNYIPISNFEGADFPLTSYQFRGEYALSCGFFEQAVLDFGKVITLNPSYSLAYLERGMAHFELGNYQSSLEDYHHYIQHKEKFSIPEFSLGFAQGLPKGIYDSCDGMLLFISDMVSHPIDTSTQVWHSLHQLRDMVSAREWALMGEILVPEVYKLVTEWDQLSSKIKGELAGYALGKHGTDILLPGAAAKVASSGITGAKELYAVLINLQQAEKLLVLESVAAMGNGAAIGEMLEQAKSVLVLGEEVGLTTQELAQLKQAGTLENAVAQKAKYVFDDPLLKASYEFYSKAEKFLENYNKINLPENKVRELIHQAGVKTFPRPQGIPENYLVKITKKGGGMEYFHPVNKDTSIMIMPGKPHSPFSYQQKPYVIFKKDGNCIDKLGKVVKSDMPEAHIPFEEFVALGL